MYKMKGKSHPIPDIYSLPEVTYLPFMFWSLVPLTLVSSILSGNYESWEI